MKDYKYIKFELAGENKYVMKNPSNDIVIGFVQYNKDLECFVYTPSAYCTYKLEGVKEIVDFIIELEWQLSMCIHPKG